MPQSHPPPTTGPLLFLRGPSAATDGIAVAVILPRPEGAPRPDITHPGGATTPTRIARQDGIDIWRAAFDLTGAGAWYAVDGARYPVRADLTGDLHIAFVSCNGQEADDLTRDPARRNRLWADLLARHRADPLHLMLQGGDQIYADEVLDADPALKAWRRYRPSGRAPLSAWDRTDLTQTLNHAFLDRYLATLGQPETAALMAEVPSFAMWDDHDICDGWGSLPTEQLDCDIGRLLFAVARRWFLIFQTGTAPDDLPEAAPDRTGRNLTLHIPLPGLDLIAPDLRSERRPEMMMGPTGWFAVKGALARATAPRSLILSTVPALGPRLSLVEAMMHYIPRAQKYEDDLRDQWQSRWHRAEWRRFLRAITGHHEGGHKTTLLSGEIHLATRATMAGPGTPVHQLVASGISHDPPPRAWAWTLGALARLGEAPLPAHPIRLHPLPGHRTIYRAERNYLLLHREGADWRARWILENSGPTPGMDL